MSESKVMELPTPIRGMLWGLAFGVAVATVHLAVGIGLILSLGQPPHTWFVLQGVLIEIGMGGVLGALVSPVLLLDRERGVYALALALTVIWLVMERWVAVDPSKPQMWLAGPLVGVVLFRIGIALSHVSVPLIGGVVVGLHALLLTVPVVKHAFSVEASTAERSAERPPARSGLPDVLFIVMDTVRAQSSSTYGYARETTPVLTSLAAEGLRFDQATAPGTWSLPAHASLFTGTFPSIHNAHGETRYLDKKLPTVAEVFYNAGYETRCFSANPHISDAFGLTRGFQSCDKAWASGDGARQFSFPFRLIDALGLGGATDKGGAVVVGNVQEWMAERGEDARPAFVFVNFLEAHFPFHQLPRDYLFAFQDRPMGELRYAGQLAFGAQMGRPLTDEDVQTIRDPIVDMYDGGVLYTDALVGDIVDVWREAGTFDDTVVVVLGDHGEVVGEHRAFGHLSAVVEEDLHVPLVFRYPPAIPQGEVVKHPVSTVGVFATLAELAGLTTPESVRVGNLAHAVPDTSTCSRLLGEEAQSCVEAAEAAALRVGQPVIAERYEEHLLSERFAPGTANGVGPLVNPRSRYRTYRSGPFKLVEHCEDGTFLFHLEVGEDQDLADTQPSTVESLRGELLSHIVDLGLPSLCGKIEQVARERELTSEERCHLCKLGYLDGPDCEGC